MAAITLWAINAAVSGHQEMSESDPGTEATITAQGWNVGTEPAGDMALFAQGTEVPRGTFTATAVPSGAIVSGGSGGDCFRSSNTYNGDFASGDWVFHLRGIAVTNASGQIDRVRVRIWRSTNADGSSATELTSSVVIGTTPGAAFTTSTAQTTTATASLGAISLSNEYIFVQVALEVTTAASMTGADVNLRIGTSATRLITPDFTVAAATSDVPGRGASARHHRTSSIYRTAPGKRIEQCHDSI